MTRPVPSGCWSWLYPHCQDCGTDEQPHYARGYCADCYRRWHGRERRKRIGQPKSTPESRAAHARYMKKWRAAKKEKTNGR
jgi:hypothetical protein